MTKGKSKGGLVSPTLFYVVVNIMVCHWLSLTVEENYATHKGLALSLGRCMGVFFDDEGIIGSKDTGRLQWAINSFIGLFRRVGLM